MANNSIWCTSLLPWLIRRWDTPSRPASYGHRSCSSWGPQPPPPRPLGARTPHTRAPCTCRARPWRRATSAGARTRRRARPRRPAGSSPAGCSRARSAAGTSGARRGRPCLPSRRRPSPGRARTTTRRRGPGSCRGTSALCAPPPPPRRPSPPPPHRRCSRARRSGPSRSWWQGSRPDSSLPCLWRSYMIDR